MKARRTVNARRIQGKISAITPITRLFNHDGVFYCLDIYHLSERKWIWKNWINIVHSVVVVVVAVVVVVVVLVVLVVVVVVGCLLFVVCCCLFFVVVVVVVAVLVVVVGEEDIEIHPLAFWLRWCDPEPDNIKLEGGWGGGRSTSPPDAGVLAAEPVSFRRHFKNNIKLELVFSLRSLAELLRFATLPLSFLDEASQTCWVLQFFHFHFWRAFWIKMHLLLKRPVEQ